jgi:hypothetical protein
MITYIGDYMYGDLNTNHFIVGPNVTSSIKQKDKGSKNHTDKANLK